ncbi:MAG TPA: hypothetical protein VKY56_07465 [Chloroflexota bacterium]|nr:hypothetical protein [Chloroflexota bacterium]
MARPKRRIVTTGAGGALRGDAARGKDGAARARIVDREPSAAIRDRLEVIAWISIAALALGLRLLNLDGAPLQPDESILALDSWRIVQGQGIDLGTAPLLVYANTVLFFVLGATDAVARSLPAIASWLVALSPLCLRRQLGRVGALVAGLLLSTSPSLVFAARSVDPTALSVALGIGVVLVLIYGIRSGDRRAVWLAGLLTALLLMSGPPGWLLALSLLGAGWLTAWRLHRSGPAEQKRVRSGDGAVTVAGDGRSGSTAAGVFTREAVRSAAIAFGGTVILVGTGLGTHLAGIGAVLSHPLAAWGESILAAGPRPTWLFPALLVGYEPAALFLGGAGAVVGLRRRSALALFLTAWAVCGIVLLLLTDARDPRWIGAAIPPLGYLAGISVQALAALLRSPSARRELGVLTVTCLPLAVTTLIAFGHVTLPDPVVPRAVAILPPLALTAIAVSLAYAFGWISVLRGGAVLLTAGLLAFGVHATTLLNPGGPLDPGELFVTDVTSPDVRTMVRDIGDILDELQIARQIEGRPVTSTVEIPTSLRDPLQWYLRDIPTLRVVDQVSDAPAIAIVPSKAAAPRGAYVGQTYQLFLRGSPPELDPLGLWRWWMYHETSERETVSVTVYVKTQLAQR